jgi:hypothetical protein
MKSADDDRRFVATSGLVDEGFAGTAIRDSGSRAGSRFLTQEEADKVTEANALVREAYRLLREVFTSPMPVGMVQWLPIERVQANDYNPNSVALHEMKLLHTSISEDGYCVEESTPILCADLRWRAAGTLRPGDKIISFDEDSSGTGSSGARKFRTGEVTFNELREDDLYRVVTERGEVLTNGEHPWLARHNYGDASQRGYQWVKTKDLTDKHDVVHLVDVWEEDLSYEAGWLSGFLDGEGTMAQNQDVAGGHSPGYRLSGYQRPGPTADRMIKEMTNRVQCSVYTHVRQEAKWHDMTMVRVDRMRETMKLLGEVRPERLIEAGQGFWEGVSTAQQNTRVKVLSVSREGRGIIASLATSTATYIAAGFAMHNTQPVVAIWDDEIDKAVIVDGFHRYTTMRRYADISDVTGGFLPVVIIDKPPADRIASTVRHNRARGKHSIAGMSKLVFDMLAEGEDDATICTKLGLEPEELSRLKHITGFSKLFKDVDYSQVTLTKTQLKERADYAKAHPEELPLPEGV